jgi:lipoprotein NlpD
MKATWLAFICAFLAGCAANGPAPVSERLQSAKNAKLKSKAVAKESDWRPDVYTVQKGDTLYSIALEHGLDYRELAEANGIEDVNVIYVGRQLKLKPAQQTALTVPLKAQPAVEGRPIGSDVPSVKSAPKPLKLAYSEKAVAQVEGQSAPVAAPNPEPAPAPAKLAKIDEKPRPAEPVKDAAGDDDDQVDWGWPVKGKVIAGFADTQNGKGVDIAGKAGQPVFASASGKVVYSGSGLRGYGKLIIIKHNKTYLSAYAHNSQILVKEGQAVSKGQKIAEMGDSDADRVKLHFEIRRLGKPVDPTKYLSN